MPRYDLRLETLHALDGGSAGVICNAALAAAVRDLDDRGDDGKPRKVVITVTLQKLDNGLAEIHVEAKAQVPVYRSATTHARAFVDGNKTTLNFQATSPENPDQSTMEFDEAE